MKSIIKVNVLALVSAISLMIGCEVVDGNNAPQNAALSEPTMTASVTSNTAVRLEKAFSHRYVEATFRYMGIYTYETFVKRSCTVRVKNLGYTKKVVVYGKNTDGVWTDLASLSYAGAADSGYELWSGSFDLYVYGVDQTLGDKSNQFIIRYEVAGNTYYDNNNGANYSLAPNDGPLLGNEFTVKQEKAEAYFNSKDSHTTASFYANIDIRNIAYAKNVSVVYTIDGWKTSATLACEYNGLTSWNTVKFYYGEGIAIPTVNGIEPWYLNGSLMLNPSITSIEYAIKYVVNGVTYWDNNYGKNYTVTVGN